MMNIVGVGKRPSCLEMVTNFHTLVLLPKNYSAALLLDWIHEVSYPVTPLFWDPCIDPLYFQHPENTEANLPRDVDKLPHSSAPPNKLLTTSS